VFSNKVRICQELKVRRGVFGLQGCDKKKKQREKEITKTLGVVTHCNTGCINTL